MPLGMRFRADDCRQEKHRDAQVRRASGPCSPSRLARSLTPSVEAAPLVREPAVELSDLRQPDDVEKLLKPGQAVHDGQGAAVLAELDQALPHRERGDEERAERKEDQAVPELLQTLA